MTDPFIFRTGEATVYASHDQGTDAMPEIVLGRVDGPVGQAFANLMGQTEGHTRMFAVRACNQQVRPATIMVPKVTMKDIRYINLFGGVVQSAVADAVLDCVIEDVLPRAEVDSLCIIALLWIDPEQIEHPDKKDLYRTNYEAMKLAVRRAVKGEPTIDELIANRKSVWHQMYHPETGESLWD